MKMPRQFVTNFTRVCEHYRCAPNEVEQMKACAMADPDGACKCFAELARELGPIPKEERSVTLAHPLYSDLFGERA
jgi:hypothetical protein